jgi:hypothetical protein
MPAGFDLMDNRVDVLAAAQLAPAFRQFREIHFLNVLGRLKEEVTAEQAEAELASLVASWGERAGVSGHVFKPGDHVMQMEPCRTRLSDPRPALWMLQAAVAFVLLIACANLANSCWRAETRAVSCRTRGARRRRRRLLAQFAVEGVMLSVVGGAHRPGHGLGWCARLDVCIPMVFRVSDIAIDPAVLASHCSYQSAGVAFGPPLLHPERCSQPSAEPGRQRATSGRQHAVRRTLVAAEVASRSCLVGAG